MKMCRSWRKDVRGEHPVVGVSGEPVTSCAGYGQGVLTAPWRVRADGAAGGGTAGPKSRQAFPLKCVLNAQGINTLLQKKMHYEVFF